MYYDQCFSHFLFFAYFGNDSYIKEPHHNVLSILFLYIFFIISLSISILGFKTEVFSPSAVEGFSFLIPEPSVYPQTGCSDVNSASFLLIADTRVLFPCLPRGLCTVCICDPV